MNTHELREMFEDEFKNDGLNFARNKHGMYEEKGTRLRWEGFKRFFESRYRLGERQLPMVGRYILGTARENGNITMARSPYRHATRTGALIEADRLVQEHGSSIYLFRCHEVIRPTIKEVIVNG